MNQVRSTVLVAGHGKLAARLICDLPQTGQLTVDAWENRQAYHDFDEMAVTHVGSGRQLPEIVAYCHAHTVPLIQGATSVDYDPDSVDFPFVVAPNLSVLMIKFLHMLQEFGGHYRGCDITIVESHQMAKKTTAGTAVEMAHALDVPECEISSMREPEVQQRKLHIPAECLAQHAVHVITISDGTTALTFTTEVLGLDAYVAGARRVIAVLDQLEQRKYRITDLIEMGLL